MKIDFVVPWVDGSDIQWQKEKAAYTGIPVRENDVQYRDYGLFKYWFRAVEEYAPWVNRIFLVTCGQVPEFLDTQHPKLCLVHHRDYMPEEYLPTFSANPIELNLHRIPELSEHFVYFNDDELLNSPVQPEDFFVDGLPKFSAILSEFTPSIVNDTFQHFLCNDIAFLNSHFKKKDVIKKNLRKWYSPVYGKWLIKNIYHSLMGSHGFSMIQNFHMPAPMLKSTYEKVWELEPDLLHQTSLHKTRSVLDVNQYIMSFYDMGTGNFVPRDPRTGCYYEIGKSDDALCDDIRKGKHQLICINDTECDNYSQTIEKLLDALNSKFPTKSSFEK